MGTHNCLVQGVGSKKKFNILLWTVFIDGNSNALKVLCNAFMMAVVILELLSEHLDLPVLNTKLFVILFNQLLKKGDLRIEILYGIKRLLLLFIGFLKFCLILFQLLLQTADIFFKSLALVENPVDLFISYSRRRAKHCQ